MLMEIFLDPEQMCFFLTLIYHIPQTSASTWTTMITTGVVGRGEAIFFSHMFFTLS